MHLRNRIVKDNDIFYNTIYHHPSYDLSEFFYLIPNRFNLISYSFLAKINYKKNLCSLWKMISATLTFHNLVLNTVRSLKTKWISSFIAKNFSSILSMRKTGLCSGLYEIKPVYSFNKTRCKPVSTKL